MVKGKAISELKQLFKDGEINEKEIALLQSDERKGVQTLLKSYERQKQHLQQLEEKFTAMTEYERKGYANGNTYIAGIDEAGRGPLAGPVVAAAVILPEHFKLLGLNDSKLLKETTRDKFFDIIKAQAVSYGIAVIDNEQIDRINIFEATKQAMYQAVRQLDPVPDHLLVDAVCLDRLPCTSEVMTKADQKSVTVAAASILAKVTRDRLMKQIHQEYPIYGFASNMGYGTKQHLDMLMQHGGSPYHRKSYAPVRNAIER
jgi:ribonuclease HII